MAQHFLDEKRSGREGELLGWCVGTARTKADIVGSAAIAGSLAAAETVAAAGAVETAEKMERK